MHSMVQSVQWASRYLLSVAFPAAAAAGQWTTRPSFTRSPPSAPSFQQNRWGQAYYRSICSFGHPSRACLWWRICMQALTLRQWYANMHDACSFARGRAQLQQKYWWWRVTSIEIADMLAINDWDCSWYLYKRLVLQPLDIEFSHADLRSYGEWCERNVTIIDWSVSL